MKISGRVLVAETKDIDAAHIKLMLERNGCKTEIVKTSSDVLSKVQNNQYLMIVLNEKLQDVDALETVREIRKVEKEKQQRTPILGITSYSLPSAIKQFKDSGADYCLRKPVYQNKLNDILVKIKEDNTIELTS